MNNVEFVSKLKEIATKYKTLYIMGCFGSPMTANNKKRYCTNHSYNGQASRTKMIEQATPDTFGFDCVCLIKGVLWGWSGEGNANYGGAVYASNNVPDIGADTMINKCRNISTDFSNIEVGEAVWMKGHIGVYIGNGLAVECSPKWDNGVQITACNRDVSGYNRRDWVKHGKLPYIDYMTDNAVQPAPVVKTCDIEIRTLQKGDKGNEVEALQILLIGRGYSCGAAGVDGSFGNSTEQAVGMFQKAMSLEVDGIVGPITWSYLLGCNN